MGRKIWNFVQFCYYFEIARSPSSEGVESSDFCGLEPSFSILEIWSGFLKILHGFLKSGIILTSQSRFSDQIESKISNNSFSVVRRSWEPIFLWVGALIVYFGNLSWTFENLTWISTKSSLLCVELQTKLSQSWDRVERRVWSTQKYESWILHFPTKIHVPPAHSTGTDGHMPLISGMP